MGASPAGAVVLVPFPFSDLSQSKLRAFARGSLRVASYARPGKLFTASDDLVVAEVGALTPDAFGRIVNAVITLIRPRRET